MSRHTSNKFGRRTVLRGLGGFCLALPFMELFSSRARGGEGSIPKRYMIGFGGCSTGMSARDKVVPAAEGPLAGQLSRGLLPLGDLGMTDSVSLVSGLKIPYGPDSSIPVGGRRINWHSTSVCPMLCGIRSNPDHERLEGPTSDWIASETLAGPTAATRPVLTYRVQPAYYRGQNGTGGQRGIISARMNGNSLEQVTPQYSPQIAYQNLFTGFVPPDPKEAAKAKRLLNRRKSIIDLVRGDTERLLPKLGAADRIRLERHFDELRGLESRLEQVKLPDGTTCKVLPDPGDDPPIGGAVDNGDTNGYAQNGAYSDEDLRASLMMDFIHMGFACDLSRVASVCYTFSQCFLNMNPLYGYPSDLHELGHYSVGGGDDGANAMADGIAWHLKHFATLAKKLKETDELDGTNMLDHTAMVLCFEGGWGYDPEQDNQGSPHSSENMIMLVAGKAGGLNASGGRHISAVDMHPAQAINTALQAVGVTQELGEVTGTIPNLIG